MEGKERDTVKRGRGPRGAVKFTGKKSHREKKYGNVYMGVELYMKK